ncbi:MAG TPA: phenylacetic acid degradation protein PaaY [Candidatus Desulfobacillus sp.]|nr:phenylacetic acid degradation protein PaaY [Candidatus Desulfobacillus sp.]
MRMVKVYSLEGVTPVVHPSSYVHPSAVLIGDVIVGPDCYIGPNACLRGDFGGIRIERGVNVQDCCIVHGFPERDTVVEENGHIGHGAILHCCRVGHDALVGMNAVVIDNAEVGEFSIVAAMAFVKAGMVVPPRSLVAGIPAKVVRPLTEQEMAWKTDGTLLYQQLARRSLASMVETEALSEVEADRKRIVLSDIKPLMEAKAEWVGAAAETPPE